MEFLQKKSTYNVTFNKCDIMEFLQSTYNVTFNKCDIMEFLQSTYKCNINKCDIMEFLQSSHFFMSHYLFLQGSSPTERQLYCTVTIVKWLSTKCMVKPQVVSCSHSSLPLFCPWYPASWVLEPVGYRRQKYYKWWAFQKMKGCGVGVQIFQNTPK